MDLKHLKEIVSSAKSGYAVLDMFIEEMLPHTRLTENEKKMARSGIDAIFFAHHLKPTIINNPQFFINDIPFKVVYCADDIHSFHLEYNNGDTNMANMCIYIKTHSIHLTGFWNMFKVDFEHNENEDPDVPIESLLKKKIKDIQTTVNVWKHKCEECGKTYEKSLDLLKHLNKRYNARCEREHPYVVRPVGTYN